MAEVKDIQERKCLKILVKPTREANIHVMESGQIRLSSLLVKKMGVKPGDRVAFFYEQTGFKSAELFLAKTKMGFKLLKVNPKFEKTDSLRFHSKKLTDLLLKDGECATTLRVGEVIEQDNLQYFTVIHEQNGTANKLQGVNEATIGY